MQIGLFKVGKDWLALWRQLNCWTQRASRSIKKGKEVKGNGNGQCDSVVRDRGVARLGTNSTPF